MMLMCCVGALHGLSRGRLPFNLSRRAVWSVCWALLLLSYLLTRPVGGRLSALTAAPPPFMCHPLFPMGPSCTVGIPAVHSWVGVGAGGPSYVGHFSSWLPACHCTLPALQHSTACLCMLSDVHWTWPLPPSSCIGAARRTGGLTLHLRTGPFVCEAWPARAVLCVCVLRWPCKSVLVDVHHCGDVSFVCMHCHFPHAVHRCGDVSQFFRIVICCIIRTLYMLSVTLTPHRAIVMKLVHTMVNVLGLMASERLGAV